MTALDVLQDQAMRTGLPQLAGLLNADDLLVTPTLACTAVPKEGDGNTVGPAEIEGRGGNPLIGW